MEKDKRYLILKYGENEIQETAKKHMKVIEDKGYCWFGKLGRALSSKAQSIVMDTNRIFFYVKGHLYFGEVEEISTKQPNGNVPEYYQEYFYDRFEFPSMYLKLNRLVEVDVKVLEDLYVDTTKKTVVESILRCMNPTIFASALCTKKL